MSSVLMVDWLKSVPHSSLQLVLADGCWVPALGSEPHKCIACEEKCSLHYTKVFQQTYFYTKV